MLCAARRSACYITEPVFRGAKRISAIREAADQLVAKVNNHEGPGTAEIYASAASVDNQTILLVECFANENSHMNFVDPSSSEGRYINQWIKHTPRIHRKLPRVPACSVEERS